MDKKHPAAMVPAAIAGTILFQAHHTQLPERIATPLSAPHLPHPLEEQPEPQVIVPTVAAVDTFVAIDVDDTLRVRFG